jgi:hypothetical protein
MAKPGGNVGITRPLAAGGLENALLDRKGPGEAAISPS